MMVFGAGSGHCFRQILVLAASQGGQPPADGPVLPDRLWACHGRLLAFLRYRCGSDELAEDLLSETYLAFLKGSPPARAFRDGDALRNYLMAIALNKLRDHFRRAGNQPERRLSFRTVEELELWLEGLADGRNDQAAALVQAEEDESRRRLVASVMAALPERYRTVLQLKFSEELANPAIAERLGLGIKALESLVVRAKAAFRAEFENQSMANERGAGRVDVIKGGRA
jgi:RNA polymerase sigma-70 factor (ECF subfamily)